MLIDIFRKRLTRFPQHDRQKTLTGIAHVLGIQRNIGLYAGRAFDGFKFAIKVFFLDAQCHFAE